MSSADRTLIAAGASALILALIGGWLLLVQTAEADEPTLLPASSVALATGMPEEHAPSTPAEIVVDVEGGVQRPGIQRLPSGARVADAIAAAGGYAPAADLLAAAAGLNLAKPLSDGEQVFVPVLGAAPASSSVAAGGGSGDSAGLVNLNTATPEELEALPGIGPVTVQKIVAARQERPFASLEEAVERGVLNRGQLDQIRELATAA